MKEAKFTSSLIRKARAKSNITQRELAKRISIHVQQVSNMERCAVGVPAVHYKKLIETLQINPKVFTRARLKDYKIQLSNEIGTVV